VEHSARWSLVVADTVMQARRARAQGEAEDRGPAAIVDVRERCGAELVLPP
jgi:hypothetical protein